MLPKEPIHYEKSSCELRDIQEMLGEFKLEGFSGYILTNFPSVQYVILIEKGVPVRVVKLSEEEEVCTTMEAVRIQLEKTPAYIAVVELPWYSVDQMVRVLMGSPLYENLLTDFVNFQKLLNTVEKKRHTGIMELLVGTRVHFLVFKFGIPQFSVLQYNSAAAKEPVEELTSMVEQKGALINFYVPKDISFVKIFEDLSNGLLEKYAELNGKRLARYMKDEMNTFLEQFDYIAITDGRCCIEKVSDDFREQEQIFKEILHHQIELFITTVGRRTTYRIYDYLLQFIHKDVQGIFQEVIL